MEAAPKNNCSILIYLFFTDLHIPRQHFKYITGVLLVNFDSIIPKRKKVLKGSSCMKPHLFTNSRSENFALFAQTPVLHPFSRHLSSQYIHQSSSYLFLDHLLLYHSSACLFHLSFSLLQKDAILLHILSPGYLYTLLFYFSSFRTSHALTTSSSLHPSHTLWNSCYIYSSNWENPKRLLILYVSA